MEYSKNPFTPTFGSVPPFLAGREHILRDINRGFINGPGDPNHFYWRKGNGQDGASLAPFRNGA